MATAMNRKRVLYTSSMGSAGVELLASRPDIEAVPFPYLISETEFQACLRAYAPVHAVVLGPTRFGAGELAATPALEVVARVGVGYDAIDIPRMTEARIPVMIAGTANSPSVAEHAMAMMMTLAKKAPALDALVKESRWTERLEARHIAVDLFEKTILIVGFGRIGTRMAGRCLAMEMHVLVYDPYVAVDAVRAAGCEPVADLDAALPRADFVSLHCPKTKETIGLMNARRLGLMKKTAYLVSTARGGIVEEPALHAALTSGGIAGAGLDVFDREPPSLDNPLFRLPNIVVSPHIAGVTAEAMDRMAVQAIENVFSVFAGRPLVENVVNRELFK